MTKYDSKKLEEVIKLLYVNADKELLALLKKQDDARLGLYNELGELALTYSMTNGLLDIPKKNQTKEITKLLKWLKDYSESDGTLQVVMLRELLRSTATATMGFYGYNVGRKEINKIVDAHYKGKHFSERVWENEEEVAKFVSKQIRDYVKGGVQIRDIKKNIQKTFNSSDYNAQRLAYTEVARVQAEAFNKFANEVGVYKVVYNAKLDGATCSDCKDRDLKKYLLKDAPELPIHPNCRCYYEVADDIEDLDLEQNRGAVGVSLEDAPKVRERVRTARAWREKYGTEDGYDEYKEAYIKERDELKKYVNDTINKDLNRERLYKNKAVAETKLRELGVKYVKLDEIDCKFYDDLVDAVELNFKKYPQLKNNVEFIGTGKEYGDFSKTILRDRNIKEYMKETGIGIKEATEYIDSVMCIGEIIDDDYLMEAHNGIKFNYKSFKKYEYVLEQQYLDFLDGTRVVGVGNMTTSFTHEIGHNMEHLLIEKGVSTGDMLDKIFRKYPETCISDYGMMNKTEYFAELYTDMMLSKSPSKEARLLEQLIEEALK